jgi:predicted nucleic acid-binding protein
MILVDTSVWVDHLRYQDEQLGRLLTDGQILAHPFVTGELAMGSLKNRSIMISDLGDLPHALTAHHQEVLELVQLHKLFGLGLGYIDAHLLASTKLTPEARLWTRDTRLHEAAVKLFLDYTPKLN